MYNIKIDFSHSLHLISPQIQIPMLSSCECWFLDVGQGASNVIYLGEGRAIVIDCGPRGSKQTIQLLKQYVKTIEALIISHNDIDHDFNIEEVLAAFPKAITRIFFLRDHPPENIRTLSVLMSQQKENYPRPERLESGKTVFSEGDIILRILYPDLMENLKAEASGRRMLNRTGGILHLKCGERRIIFSGDATIEAWESLASRMRDEKPLCCDVMTVPHHGGKISQNPSQENSCQEKLYSEIIKPSYGIISVGTINQPNHPSPEAISALRKAGVNVLCTQMTKKCSGDLEAVRSLRRIMNRPARSKHNESRTQGGNSKNVACFGSVVAEISTDYVKISNLDRYKKEMENFADIREFQPLYRQ